MAARLVETVVEYETQPPCKTADEMEQICCEPTEALQCCETIDPDWQGYTVEELLEKYHPGLDDMGRDSAGRYVVIELAPRKNPCGEKVINFDVSGGNCCDEVLSDVSFDLDSTPDILPAGGKITVYVSGGRPPYTFTVTSAATSFSPNGLVREKTTSSQYLDLFADETFCGGTELKVTDGCSSDTTTVRSDLGEWVLDPGPDGEGDCLFPGVTPEYTSLMVDGQTYTGDGYVRGMRMQLEHLSIESSYDLGLYWGATQNFIGHDDPCPGFAEGACIYLGEEVTPENRGAFHCGCVTALGLPIVSRAPCSKKDPVPSYWMYECGDLMWVDTYGGFLFDSGSGCGPHNSTAYVGRWWEQDAIHTFTWRCS